VTWHVSCGGEKVSIFAWGELGEQCADLLAERGDGSGRLSATAPLVS